jgi:hypothetical protein
MTASFMRATYHFSSVITPVRDARKECKSSAKFECFHGTLASLQLESAMPVDFLEALESRACRAAHARGTKVIPIVFHHIDRCLRMHMQCVRDRIAFDGVPRQRQARFAPSLVRIP